MTGNQIANRVSAITGQLVSHGRIRIKNSETALILKSVAGFSFGFVISTAQIFGDRSPFGLGLGAICEPSLPGICTFLGLVCGYLISGGFIWALKYLAALALIISASFSFRKTELSLKEWFAPLNAGFMTVAIGFIYLGEVGLSPINVLLMLIEALIAASAARSYQLLSNSLRDNFEIGFEDTQKTIAALFLLASVLIALAGIKLLKFVSIGGILSAACVMLISFDGRITYGCSAAIIIGISMDACANSAPYFTVIYAVSSIISSVFSRHGKYLFALSFFFVASAAAAWSGTDAKAISALIEILAGCAVFTILPKRFISSFGAFFPSARRGDGARRACEYTQRRVDQASEAFRELYETVRHSYGEGQNDDEVASVFDKAAEKVCRSCPLSNKCWQVNYQSTLNIFNDITPLMLEKGELSPDDFPDYFSENCKNIESLTENITSEAKSLLYRRSYRKKLLERQGVAYNQYYDISSVLRGLSRELRAGTEHERGAETRLIKYLKSIDVAASVAVFRDRGGRLHAEISAPDLFRLKKYPDYLDRLSYVLEVRLCTSEMRNSYERLELLEAEPLSASVGIASAKKDGQAVSGDRCIYFKTDEGMLYIILSDGMGTGEEALMCSEKAVYTLEKFLRAGVAPETAVRILNNLMLLKNETDTVSATIDLVCINLFTGDTKIFKYGAAPSYIRKTNSVDKISCQSFASGLATSFTDGPDVTRLKLRPPSVAVIASDGVTGGYDDSWIMTYIEEYEGTSPKELARNIVKTSCDKFGCDDDITVLTVFMEQRN